MADEFDPQKIEEYLKNLKVDKNQWKFGAGIALVLLFLVLFSSNRFTPFYTNDAEEVGVVQRFGRFLTITQPGLHFKIPFVDDVTKIKTRRVYKEEFGYATATPGVRTSYERGGSSKDVSLMLTGDLNIADVEWAVHYRIQEPQKFIFNVRDPIRTLRDASEAAMRLIVGDRSVDEVLTVGREEINLQCQIKLQEILDSYETGIRVVTIELQDVNPPDQVKASFDDVNNAKQERETMVNKAREAYNKVIPKARGEAEQLVTAAEGYATKRINEAKGDATRFLEVYKAYAASPTVTKRKLYIETMEQTLSRLENVWIVDDQLKNIIPMLQSISTPLTSGGGK